MEETLQHPHRSGTELSKSMEILVPSVKKLNEIQIINDVDNVQTLSPYIALESDYIEIDHINVTQLGFSSQYVDDVKEIGRIHDVLLEGNSHAHVLYTFRSLSRAIPMQVKSLFLRFI